MSVATVVLRNVPGVEQIVGCDLSEAHARAMVEWGQATWGPAYDLPPALYLLEDLDMRGLRWPAGWMLTVGYEISECEALLLMRGTDRHVVSVPPGGVG